MHESASWVTVLEAAVLTPREQQPKNNNAIHLCWECSTKSAGPTPLQARPPYKPLGPDTK